MSISLAAPARISLFRSLVAGVSSIQLTRPSWSIPCEPGSSSQSLQKVESGSSVTSLFPSLQGLLELLPPILLGTPPKKKVSRARRGKAMVHKWLKNRTNISVCLACGHPHLMHHVCHNCFSQIKRRWKAEARGDVFEPPVLPKRWQPQGGDGSSPART